VTSADEGLPFVKVHSLGNDFILFDGRKAVIDFGASQATRICDRYRGVGADQLLTLLPSARADAYLRIQNTDGRDVGACGNATRCVGRLLSEELGRHMVTIETAAGVLSVYVTNGTTALLLDAPKQGWRDVPLATARDTADFEISGVADDELVCHAAAMSFGNPHVVVFTGDVAAPENARIAPLIENHPLFPDGVNVGFAQIVDRRRLRLRVWERSIGFTRACGTGSCAAVVAGLARGLLDRSVTVALDGGELIVTSQADGRIRLEGPVEVAFHGSWPIGQRSC
jgi:diaminopimelate epimerase